MSPAGGVRATQVGSNRRLSGLWVGAALLATIVAIAALAGTAWLTVAGAGAAGESELSWTLPLAATAIVGALILLKRPGNSVGIVLASGGIAGVVTGFANSFADYSLLPSTPHLPGTTAFAWLGSWVWVPAIAALPALVFLFPDGRPLRGWRWFLWSGLGIAAVGMAVAPPQLWSLPASVLADRKQLDQAAEYWLIDSFVAPLEMAILALALVSLIIRYRRSPTHVRLQIKWLIAGVVVLLGSVLMFNVIPSLFDVKGSDWITAAGFGAIPAAVGVAVFRYKLYEIDRIISRSVSYGIVTALAVGLFALVVLAPTAALGSGDAPPWLVAAATLVAAGAFNPLRRRVQAVVDRRFNRARYDAQVVADGFATRLRDPRELETVTADLTGTVAATVQPDRLGLWMRR